MNSRKPKPLRLHVLLVDDDSDQRWLVRDALEEMPCEIREVDNAEDALAMLLPGGDGGPTIWPDVIFLDVEMPGMSGTALLERIKTDPRLKNLSVVLVTGQAFSDEQYREALAKGADGFIPKTNDIMQMLEQLKAAVRQQACRNGWDNWPEKRAG